MNGIFQKTFLKSIFCDENGNWKIENVESILVSKLCRILHSFYYSGCGYNSFTKNELRILRGFRPKIDRFKMDNENNRIAHYFELFFAVGEKGKAYHGDVTKDDALSYFGAMNYSDEIENVLSLTNSVLSKNGFGIINYDTLKEIIGNESEVYHFLINLAHNIGHKWKNKDSSPFVSATYGKNAFETALNFAQYNNGNKYSYIMFAIAEDCTKNATLTKKFNEILKKMNIEWYEDIHKEIIIKDAIFPQNILGVFQIDNFNEKVFIVNPNLYKLVKSATLSRNSDFTQICNLIHKNGVLTDQSRFEDYASQLGYSSYGRRTIDGNTHVGVIGKEPTIKIR